MIDGDERGFLFQRVQTIEVIQAEMLDSGYFYVNVTNNENPSLISSCRWVAQNSTVEITRYHELSSKNILLDYFTTTKK